jgi:hypothetical protein
MGVLYDKVSRYEGPITVDVTNPIDYADMMAYLESWPGKLLEFMSDHLADDDKREFVQELYDYICEPDEHGPAFEEWRKT